MNSNITLNIGKPTGRTVHPISTFGANSCHSALWLRNDLPRHYKRLHDELGMKYVRCHGNLNDDLGLVAEDGSFHFEKIIQVISRILANGQRPFLELSSMPGKLCRNDAAICHYRFRTSPPSDWQMWENLIRELTKALAAEFGTEEMLQWYFEVWNEPDLSFWGGNQEDYFRLYDHAWKAVKSVDPRFRVGGPATSKTVWIADFVQYVSKPSAICPETNRCDFVSTHAYPNDIAFLDAAAGDTKLLNANVMRQLYRRARQDVDAVFGPEMPLFIGEWNSSSGPLAWNHDECANAAFVAKTMYEVAPYCAGSLYWDGTDIYEECGFHYQPFHGGYGLITVNDIPKSAFHAFRFLREMDGTEIPVMLDGASEEVGACAVEADGECRLLIWNYKNPDQQIHEPAVIRLPDGGWSCSHVKPGQGSAYETWVEAGRPDYPNRALLEKLEAAAVPACYTVTDGEVITLQSGEIAFLKLQK